MFGNDRTAMRRYFAEAWRRRQAGETLDPLQQIVSEVVRQHPEYHALIDQPDALHREFTPEQGQSNPFLHMGMHIGLQEQISTDRPAGIAALYREWIGRSGDPHAVEHQMMECLGEMLWQAQRDNAAPDEQAYLECLRRLAGFNPAT